MDDFFQQINYYFLSIYNIDQPHALILMFFPFVIFFEFPYNTLIVMASYKAWLKKSLQAQTASLYYPFVTVIVTAYKESFQEMHMTLLSISEQIYPGS